MNYIKLFIINFLFFLGSTTDVTAQKDLTYKVGKTTYIIGENYSTTSYPKVKRSSSTKKEFLRSQGYEKTPSGYEIDHIEPLSKGGTDEVWNMQLLSKKEHKLKTARERASNKSSNWNKAIKPYKSSSYKIKKMRW